MPNLDFLNNVAAPEWFIENMDEADRLRKEAEKLMGIKDKYFDEVKKDLQKRAESGEKIADVEMFRKSLEMGKRLAESGKIPMKETLDQASLIANYGKRLSEYTWGRFRYENKDNNFGMADDLHYNKKEKLIQITKNKNDRQGIEAIIG